jgi:hypothetical protein
MTLERSALIEALEAPRGQRDERALRVTFRSDNHDGEHTSGELAALVRSVAGSALSHQLHYRPIQAEDAA